VATRLNQDPGLPNEECFKPTVAEEKLVCLSSLSRSRKCATIHDSIDLFGSIFGNVLLTQSLLFTNSVVFFLLRGAVAILRHVSVSILTNL
jgi:hypothetical protein